MNTDCPSCGKTLKCDDKLRGKTSRCPKCRATIQIPMSDSKTDASLVHAELVEAPMPTQPQIPTSRPPLPIPLKPLGTQLKQLTLKLTTPVVLPLVGIASAVVLLAAILATQLLILLHMPSRSPTIGELRGAQTDDARAAILANLPLVRIGGGTMDVFVINDPNVHVLNTLDVNVSNTPGVEVTNRPQVDVNDMPTVEAEIINTQKVEVLNWPLR